MMYFCFEWTEHARYDQSLTGGLLKYNYEKRLDLTKLQTNSRVNMSRPHSAPSIASETLLSK